MEGVEIAQEFGLLTSDCPTVMELCAFIPESELYKRNIGMPRPFWRDWWWSFGVPLLQYDSHRLYSALHQRHTLSPILNARCTLSDSED